MRDSGSPTSNFSDITPLLNCQENPVAFLSSEGEILAANISYRREFADGDVVVGRYCYEVSHGYEVPCHEKGVSCPLRLADENEQKQRCVHVHHTPHGEEHHDVTACPIVSENGEGLLGFLEMIHHSRVASIHPTEEGLVGRSQAFNEMLELVERVAPTDTTVLLVGESGTGKELVAQAIHDRSHRASGPFVPVDCSGLAETLFESELFGHEKGAFTGAYTRKQGLVEAARHGTLFLDEVGDIPVALQVKILRLLESRMFRRVGSVDPVRAEFRMICATHRDLESFVEDGLFRRDLYYRISPFPIELPRLRDRGDDLEVLAETMLLRMNHEKQLTLHKGALDLLKDYEFLGNVRELRNILERAALLADGEVIRPEHLPESVQVERDTPPSMAPPGKILPLKEVEYRYLDWVVRNYRGDNADLARKLGLSERTFYRKLRRCRRKNEACCPPTRCCDPDGNPQAPAG